MSTDMMIVFALAIAAMAFFVIERLPVGLVAVTVMASLMLTGVLSTAEGLSGFSSRATIAIGAMFMLSEGVRRTGALDLTAAWLARTGRGRPQRTLFAMMAAVGAISALINNTAAIAIFIPVVLSVSESMHVSPSRLLMPLSFASMLGGVCTLVGTSTNILVSEIAVDHGLESIGMFELTPVALVFLAMGFVYLLTIGRRLVPERRRSERMSGYEISRYISEVVVRANSPLVGRRLEEARDLSAAEIEVVDVRRDGHTLNGPTGDVEPHPGDVLRIHGEAKTVQGVIARSGLELFGTGDWRKSDPSLDAHVLVEAIVAPDSPLAGRRIRDIDFRNRLGASLLALRQRGSLRHTGLGDARLRESDCLLLAADRERIESLQRDPAVVPFNLISEERFRRDRMWIALAVIVGVVGATAFGLAPIVLSALVGVVVMMLTGCLRLEEGLQAVHWEVILLLAGMIPLGLALQKTGGATLLAETITGWLGAWGPRAVLAGLFLLTILLTSILNNQASAVLLAPMAIELARAMSVDPRAFLIAVTFGASLSFITPVGYQTNTMIYGPGQYRFSDFFRVGAGLNLLLWIAGVALIPLVWPL